MRRITIFCPALALILLGFTGLAGAQNVSIQLTAYAPIQIPGQGGSFNYIISAINNGASPQQATVWCMITLPDSSLYGPVLGPITITLSPGQTIDRQRTQSIPPGAPAGNYSFNAYIGIYPDSVWDSDNFPFAKLAAGTELWVARYNGPGHYYDRAKSVATDSAGSVYITGYSYESLTDYDYTTIKYDGNGNQVWLARYNNQWNEPDYATALALDGAGNVYVTGRSAGDYATVKYGPAGVQQWAARYSGPGNEADGATAIAVDLSGNIVVTGYVYTAGTLANYCTIKYNSDGAQLWVAQYNSPGNLADFAYALAIDAFGNVCVTGQKRGFSWSSHDYCTVKYDSNGIQQWVASYNGPGNLVDGANSVSVDAGGNVYVTGGSYGIGTYSDYCTIKYSPEGVQLWVARYNGPANDDDDALSMVVSPNGDVYITGFSGIGLAVDYYTIKYDFFGIQQWIARYNGPNNYTDIAQSIVVDGSRNVYVTGYSGGSETSFDYATIKYSPEGVQQWIARYNGTGNDYDEATSLAVDRSGNVLVTGFSYGVGTWSDYATIKYSGGNIDNWMPVEATVFGQPLPQECALHQNYPNPFNATTVLRYKMQDARHVSLRIFDTAGRLVDTLVDGWRSAGVHELTFDASDLPSGMYFAKLETGDYVRVQKIVMVK
jgi:hypothetical protein